MNSSEPQNKNEKTKTKFSSLNINGIYQNSNVQNKPAQRNRYGLQQLGKVQGTRRTPKASWVPSLQSESGMQQQRSDPNGHSLTTSSISVHAPQPSSSGGSSTCWRKSNNSSMQDHSVAPGDEVVRQESSLGGSNMTSIPTERTIDPINAGRSGDADEMVSKTGPPQLIRLQNNVSGKFMGANPSMPHPSSSSSNATRVPFSQTAINASKEKPMEGVADAKLSSLPPCSSNSSGNPGVAAGNAPSSSTRSTHLLASLLPSGADPSGGQMSRADYFSTGWAAMDEDEETLSTSTGAHPSHAPTSHDLSMPASSSASDVHSYSSKHVSIRREGLPFHEQPQQPPPNVPRQQQQQQPQAYFYPNAVSKSGGYFPGPPASLMATGPVPQPGYPLHQHQQGWHPQSFDAGGGFYAEHYSHMSGAFLPGSQQPQPPVSHRGPPVTPGDMLGVPQQIPLIPTSSWSTGGRTDEWPSTGGTVTSPMDPGYNEVDETELHESSKHQRYREAIRKGKSKKVQGMNCESPHMTAPNGEQVQKVASETVTTQVPPQSLPPSTSGTTAIPLMSSLPTVQSITNSTPSADSQLHHHHHHPHYPHQQLQKEGPVVSSMSQDERFRHPSATSTSTKTQHSSHESYATTNAQRGTGKKYAGGSTHEPRTQEASYGRSQTYRDDQRQQQPQKSDYYNENAYHQDKSRPAYRQQGTSGYYHDKNVAPSQQQQQTAGYYAKNSARSLREEYANEYYSRYTSQGKSGQVGKEKGSSGSGKTEQGGSSSVSKAENTGASSSYHGDYEYDMEYGEVWAEEGDQIVSTMEMQGRNYPGGAGSYQRPGPRFNRGGVAARGGRGVPIFSGKSQARHQPGKPGATSNEPETCVLSGESGEVESRNWSNSAVSATTAGGSEAMVATSQYEEGCDSSQPQVVPLLSETDFLTLDKKRAAAASAAPFFSGPDHRAAAGGSFGTSRGKRGRGAAVTGQREDFGGRYHEEGESSVSGEKPTRSFTGRGGRGGRGGGLGTGRGGSTTRNFGDHKYKATGEGRRGVAGKGGPTANEEKGKTGSDDEETENTWETASEGSDLSGNVHTYGEGDLPHHRKGNSGGGSSTSGSNSQRPTTDNGDSGKSSSHNNRNHHPRGGGAGSAPGAGSGAGGNSGVGGGSGASRSASSTMGGSSAPSGRNNYSAGTQHGKANQHNGRDASSSSQSSPPAQNNNSALVVPTEATVVPTATSNSTTRPTATVASPANRLKTPVDTSAYSNVVRADSLPQTTEEELILEAISNAVEADLPTNESNVLGFQEVLSKSAKRNRKRQEELVEQQKQQNEKVAKSHHANGQANTLQSSSSGPHVSKGKTGHRVDSNLPPEARKKEYPVKESLHSKSSSHAIPAPEGAPTPLLDAAELLAVVQPHHHFTERNSLPPRLMKLQGGGGGRQNEKGTVMRLMDGPSLDTATIHSQSKEEEVSSSIGAPSNATQPQPPVEQLVSIDEWRNDYSGAQMQEMVASTSMGFENGPRNVSSYLPSVDSRSSAERVAWEMCEPIVGQHNSLTATSVYNNTMSSESVELLQQQQQHVAMANLPNAMQRTRSTSASTCKSAASIGNLPHGVAALNFGGSSGAGHLSPTQVTSNNNTGINSNICKVKPQQQQQQQQQMIHEEDNNTVDTYCVTMVNGENIISSSTNSVGATSAVSYAMSMSAAGGVGGVCGVGPGVSAEQMLVWSNTDGSQLAMSSSQEVQLSSGPGGITTALQLEDETRRFIMSFSSPAVAAGAVGVGAGGVDDLEKAGTLLEFPQSFMTEHPLQSTVKPPAVLPPHQQPQPPSAPQTCGLIMDGGEMFSANSAAYQLVYPPNSIINSEFQPRQHQPPMPVSSELMWHNNGPERFQPSPAPKSLSMMGQYQQLSEATPYPTAYGGGITPDSMMTTTNATNGMNAYQHAGLIGMQPPVQPPPHHTQPQGGGPSFLPSVVEFSSILQSQVAQSPYLAAAAAAAAAGGSYAPQPQPMPQAPPHLQQPTAGTNTMNHPAGFLPGSSASAGMELASAGNSVANMHFLAAMLQQHQQQQQQQHQQHQQHSQSQFPHFMRQDSQPQMATPPANGGVNTAGHHVPPSAASALFMFQPQSAAAVTAPHVSLMQTATVAAPGPRPNFLSAPGFASHAQVGGGRSVPRFPPHGGIPIISSGNGEYSPAVDMLAMPAGLFAPAAPPPPLNLYAAATATPPLLNTPPGGGGSAMPGFPTFKAATGPPPPQSMILGGYAPTAVHMNKAMQQPQRSNLARVHSNSSGSGAGGGGVATSSSSTTYDNSAQMGAGGGGMVSEKFNHYSANDLNLKQMMMQMSRFGAAPRYGGLETGAFAPSLMSHPPPMAMVQPPPPPPSFHYSPHSTVPSSRGGGGGSGGYKRHYHNNYNRIHSNPSNGGGGDSTSFSKTSSTPVTSSGHTSGETNGNVEKKNGSTTAASMLESDSITLNNGDNTNHDSVVAGGGGGGNEVVGGENSVVPLLPTVTAVVLT